MMSDLRGVVANPRFNLLIRFHNLPFFFISIFVTYVTLYILGVLVNLCVSFYLVFFSIYLRAPFLLSHGLVSHSLSSLSLNSASSCSLKTLIVYFWRWNSSQVKKNIDNFGKAYFFRISQIRVRAFYWIIETECFWLFGDKKTPFLTLVLHFATQSARVRVTQATLFFSV